VADGQVRAGEVRAGQVEILFAAPHEAAAIARNQQTREEVLPFVDYAVECNQAAADA